MTMLLIARNAVFQFKMNGTLMHMKGFQLLGARRAHEAMAIRQTVLFCGMTGN